MTEEERIQECGLFESNWHQVYSCIYVLLSYNPFSLSFTGQGRQDGSDLQVTPSVLQNQQLCIICYDSD